MTAEGIDFAPLMGPVARRLLGEPNPELSREAKGELRFGTRGSLSVDLKRGVWHDHEAAAGGGVLDLIRRESGLANSAALAWLRQEGFEVPNNLPFEERIECAYRYETADGRHAFDVVRLRCPKDFRQRAPGGKWSVKGIAKVPYRLPQLLAADPAAPVFIVEGEKDADRLAALGLVATTNAGGAGKWHDGYAKPLLSRRVAIIPDADEAGAAHAEQIRASLAGAGIAAVIVALEGLPPKGDVADWLAAGGTPARLLELAEARWRRRRRPMAPPKCTPGASTQSSAPRRWTKSAAA